MVFESSDKSSVPKLCSGDSGGPVFMNSSLSAVNEFCEKNKCIGRRVVAINSSGGPYRNNVNRASAAANLHSPYLKNFLAQASVENGFKKNSREVPIRRALRVCGLTLKPGKGVCRK